MRGHAQKALMAHKKQQIVTQVKTFNDRKNKVYNQFLMSESLN